MPSTLDHVNVYLLRCETGWLIIDTGLDSPEARATWEDIFTGALRGEPVIGVLSTHYHVDHTGLVGFLTESRRIPLYMTYGEYFTLRGWPVDTQEVAWQHAEFYRQVGLPEELLPRTLLMFDFARQISRVPPAFNRLHGGCPLPVAGGDWQVRIGRGHSPEMALLFSARQRILIAGDQLLPRISSNVSVSIVDTEDEPLSRWLTSLGDLAELPEDTLVLPSHGLPFRGIHTRLAELRAHHDHQLQVVLTSCGERPASTYELSQVMYPFPLPDFNLLLAIGECLAHIRYLLSIGRLCDTLDDQGVLRYRTVPR